MGKGSVSDEQAGDPSGLIRKALGTRSIVLVGMMGAGKSSVGKRLAQRLGLPFADADGEIESAAGMTIPEIFAQRGEAEFRQGEHTQYPGAWSGVGSFGGWMAAQAGFSSVLVRHDGPNGR